MKKETLEEAAEIYENKDQHERSKLDFINGAKWQQEQDKKMYSDLVDLLEKLRPIYKEDSVSHFKYEKQRINIIEQILKK